MDTLDDVDLTSVGPATAGLVGVDHQAGQTPQPTGMCSASRTKMPVVNESLVLMRTDWAQPLPPVIFMVALPLLVPMRPWFWAELRST